MKYSSIIGTNGISVFIILARIIDFKYKYLHQNRIIGVYVFKIVPSMQSRTSGTGIKRDQVVLS